MAQHRQSPDKEELRSLYGRVSKVKLVERERLEKTTSKDALLMSLIAGTQIDAHNKVEDTPPQPCSLCNERRSTCECLNCNKCMC